MKRQKIMLDTGSFKNGILQSGFYLYFRRLL